MANEIRNTLLKIPIPDLMREAGAYMDELHQRIRELEQQVAEYEARDSRYWHSVQKRTDGQAQRIRELEDAILNHLVENGYQDSEETLNWWVEQHQPCDVRTAKLEALNNE